MDTLPDELPSVKEKLRSINSLGEMALEAQLKADQTLYKAALARISDLEAGINHLLEMKRIERKAVELDRQGFESTIKALRAQNEHLAKVGSEMLTAVTKERDRYINLAAEKESTIGELTQERDDLKDSRDFWQVATKLACSKIDLLTEERDDPKEELATAEHCIEEDMLHLKSAKKERDEALKTSYLQFIPIGDTCYICGFYSGKCLFPKINDEIFGGRKHKDCPKPAPQEKTE